MINNFDSLSTSDKRTYLQGKLSLGVVTVTFTKVNGEKRVMPCTLAPWLIPPAPVKESSTPKKENLDVLRVFCTDKQEWRSFRIDSVSSIADGANSDEGNVSPVL